MRSAPVLSSSVKRWQGRRSLPSSQGQRLGMGRRLRGGSSDAGPGNDRLEERWVGASISPLPLTPRPPLPRREAWGEGEPPASQELTQPTAPRTLLPPPLSPQVGEGWRSRGEGNSLRLAAGEGTRTTTISLPLTPRPPLPRRELGERGSLRRLRSLHNQLHLTRSSQHPSPRRWERGGVAGVRASCRPVVRATAPLASPHPLAPSPTAQAWGEGEPPASQ